ncbi:Nitroreductase family protein [Asanoa hainanensis]|uniref:Nitroreductase family protein n=1 Tax=Asanoa hainanensis TaxID=560556 RepID=A0A239LDS5_9ACTN|nr:Nitroreductase family protein [Asanoa hainanensis]
MVRSYELDRPVPPEVVDRILHNGLRAPSAGMSQGWGFLVLDTAADLDRYAQRRHLRGLQHRAATGSAKAPPPDRRRGLPRQLGLTHQHRLALVVGAVQ